MLSCQRRYNGKDASWRISELLKRLLFYAGQETETEMQCQLLSHVVLAFYQLLKKVSSFKGGINYPDICWLR